LYNLAPSYLAESNILFSLNVVGKRTSLDFFHGIFLGSGSTSPPKAYPLLLLFALSLSYTEVPEVFFS